MPSAWLCGPAGLSHEFTGLRQYSHWLMPTLYPAPQPGQVSVSSHSMMTCVGFGSQRCCITNVCMFWPPSGYAFALVVAVRRFTDDLWAQAEFKRHLPLALPVSFQDERGAECVACAAAFGDTIRQWQHHYLPAWPRLANVSKQPVGARSLAECSSLTQPRRWLNYSRLVMVHLRLALSAPLCLMREKK